VKAGVINKRTSFLWGTISGISTAQAVKRQPSGGGEGGNFAEGPKKGGATKSRRSLSLLPFFPNKQAQGAGAGEKSEVGEKNRGPVFAPFKNRGYRW